MSKPWHRDDPTRFAKEKAEVEAEYPELHFRITGDMVFVYGTFPVRFEGQTLDRYSVEVALGRDHPKTLPIVREVGGRIPWIADRHVNTNGTACVLLPDERWTVWPDESTILDFLNGPLRNFFLGQSLVEQGKPWPFGQWDHGASGIREYYAELLGTDDVQVIRGYLECLAAKKIKGHWSCPCGSGKRLRECHLETLRDLQQKIARRDAVNSLNYLRG